MNIFMRWILFYIGFLVISPAGWAGEPVIRPIEAGRIVAIVNNEVITAYDLRLQLARVEKQIRKQHSLLPPQAVLDRQVLERLIVDRIQLQMAKDLSLQVNDVQLDTTLTRIAGENQMSVVEFRVVIEKEGISWVKFREDIRNEILIARLKEQEVDNRVFVSEAEVDSFLLSAQARAGSNEEMLIQHILLRIPDQADAKKRASIQARAEEIVKRARSTTDFSQLAATYSEAPDALSGGSIGWRAADRLPSLFSEVAAGMAPGEVSSVLKSPAGYHIVKLVQRRGAASAGEEAVAQVHPRHILIKTSEIVSDTEAKRRILDLKARIEHGEKFTDLARKYSGDLSAAKGGDLGWLFQGDTVPEFEQAMSALKVGELSSAVRTSFGWHLIQVLERRVGTSQERQRAMARQAIRERKSDEAYQDWLRQIRDRAYVDSRLDDK